MTLRDMLLVIVSLLLNPNPDSALNSEASGLMHEVREGHARIITSLCHAMR